MSTNARLRNVGVFVDLSNLYHCVGKKYPNHKLDYSKLRDLLVGNDILFRAIAYGVQTGNEASKFIERLRRFGYEPKYKQVRIIQIGEEEPRYIKTNWNVGMTLDVVSMIDKLDTIVICSSDPELVPLVEYIKARGLKCIVASAGISRNLRITASSYLELDETVLEEQQ